LHPSTDGAAREGPEPRATSAVAFAVPDIDDDDIEAVTDVLRSGWITSGSQCVALEEELAIYLGVPHVVAMSSATAALETAVAFLRLPPGSRIGIPTWTFVSTAISAVHGGLHPVLLDVDPDTLNLDLASLERAIDSGLSAVTGVHFAGVPFGRPIHDACAAERIPLIEDCAHSLGARDHRGLAAGLGTSGACFSFYATKNLTSGEGGALATDDDELAAFAKSFRLHGLSADAWQRYRPGASSGYDLLAPGIKGNLSDVLAALARSQLRRFDRSQARRRELVERYRSGLADVDVQFVPGVPVEGSADHLVVVLLPERVERSAVVAELSAHEVSSSVHFQPLHTFGWFARHASVGPGGTPNADAVAARALSLPLHTRLSFADVDRVCAALGDALR
jgi:dTDP-4-amino-4,6-dideoxygalactose transaminase